MLFTMSHYYNLCNSSCAIDTSSMRCLYDTFTRCTYAHTYTQNRCTMFSLLATLLYVHDMMEGKFLYTINHIHNIIVIKFNEPFIVHNCVYDVYTIKHNVCRYLKVIAIMISWETSATALFLMSMSFSSWTLMLFKSSCILMNWNSATHLEHCKNTQNR